MKRAKEDSTNDGVERKKRVKFDPSVKDNEPAPSAEPVEKPPRRLRNKDTDGLDILGRKIEQQGAGTSQFTDDPEVEVKSKHTLDSDEEDEKYEPKRLDINSIHGQEQSTIEYDGSIKIMPFNMKDEEDEGHYDEEGNYVFNKNKDDIRDEWLDNLDWDAVKHKAGEQWNKMEDDEDSRESTTKTDGVAACERILKYLDDKTLAPNEKSTVNDVLKKLNSQKNLSAAEERKRRWEAKKKGVEYKNEFSEFTNELTGAADDLVTLGHMNTYSMSKAEINTLCEELEIEKERAERAARSKQLEEEAKKREANAAKVESKESLINDLMSDEEEDAEADDNQKQDDVEMSEFTA